MATATAPKTRTLVPEQRVVLRGISWEAYEAILQAVGDQPAVRITYDRGDLELMASSFDHEAIKSRLGRMVETLTMELDLPCEAAGSTTWRKKLEERGVEPDECYYLANAERVVGKKAVDLNVDPPPDLAIEVEISRSALNKRGVYAALGVPELWRFDGEDLHIDALQPDGTYLEVPASPSFPFWRPEEIVHWVGLAENTGQTLWIRQFRNWVLDVLTPRLEGR